VRGRAAAAFAARLTLENVSRAYDETAAVSDVTIDVAPGEVICLLGPSGCGKTTLLRIISGVEHPDSGRVLINGDEVAGPNRIVPPEARGCGLMFQDFALFPHLNILENVAFGLRSLPRAEAERVAMSLLARVGLESSAKLFPHVLSGGQQQRVALARALAPRPSVMLLDEPFSGLDVQLRSAMQEETLMLLRETRATSIIVTHHPEEAMRMGDRIAVMRAGRIVQSGSAEDLYHHPADLFVARLFSEINEIQVTTGEAVIDTPIGQIPAAGFRQGETAVLGIRERGIDVAAQGPGLPGRVMHVKFLGDVVLLEIGVSGFDQPLRVRTKETGNWAKGADVFVSIDPERVLVFPNEPVKAANPA
jgi:iron(III) transport system ATP-binding protein